MESSLVSINRLKRSRNWGYSSNSQAALWVADRLANSHFPVSTIGEHITGVSGGTTPRGAIYPETGALFIRVGNVQPHGLDLSDVAHIDTVLHNSEMRRSQLKADDVLLAITGATFGKACVVPDGIGDANINQHIARIRTKPQLNPHYLALFFNSELGTKQSQMLATGGTRPALSYEAIRAARIPLPTREEQDRIVEILQAAYATRSEKSDEAYRLTEKVYDIVLNELGISSVNLVDNKSFLVNISKLIGNRFDSDLYNTKYSHLMKQCQYLFGDNFVTLKSVCYPITSGATPLGSRYTNVGVPFLRVQNIKDDGSVDLSDLLFVSNDFAKTIKRAVVQNGDLLLVIVGATIGKCSVARGIKSLTVPNQAIARIRLKEDAGMSVDFLQAFLSSPAGQIQIGALKRPVAQGNLSLTETGLIRVPMLPLETQQKICNEVLHRRSESLRLRIEAKDVVTQAKVRVEGIMLGEEAP